MFDYSFFALLFVLVSALAPDAGAERAWVNSRYPEQRIAWTPEGDGWAMRVNGREVGVFHLDGDDVVHHTGQNEPRRIPIASLTGPVTRDARRIVLRGRFAPTVLAVERQGGELRLVDASRELLRVPLILSSR